MAKQILPKSKKRGPKAKPNPPRADLSKILSHFNEARAFLECGMQLLEINDNVGPEGLCLEHGMRLLKAVYTELDLAIAKGAK